MTLDIAKGHLAKARVCRLAVWLFRRVVVLPNRPTAQPLNRQPYDRTTVQPHITAKPQKNDSLFVDIAKMMYICRQYYDE